MQIELSKKEMIVLIKSYRTPVIDTQSGLYPRFPEVSNNQVWYTGELEEMSEEFLFALYTMLKAWPVRE